ncbi:MAG TPA: class I SAM-dependent methyltransferase [Cyclobacteriaceae bacterium]|jgi:SAM-dependent methyltransferase|nr:class I SAM-dependent methyltransferase [Cyclobacteriaceae bacterium]
MAKIYTTEITSDQLPSDNPLHQRLLKPYLIAPGIIRGDLLEIGCGEGRGIAHLLPAVSSYAAIDKIETAVEHLRQQYPSGKFVSGHLPPLPYPNNSFDAVVTFQVIEHIQDDMLFLQEIHRVLRPGGVALITTPNRPLSLSRNPWHIREYTADELSRLARQTFDQVEMRGITGNEKVMAYHERNRQSVQRLMRWDVLDLQYRLPAWVLRIPYDLMNRLNRNKLQQHSDELVRSITANDYIVTDDAATALDLFVTVRK